ncbi:MULTISPECIES: hypothetical protein [unclassified Nocardioides]
MQALIIGGVAFLVGAGLAGATAFGVVNSATSGTFQPASDNVLEYGTTNQ